MTSEFKLDTSGEVRLQNGVSIHGPPLKWSDLDPFQQGYTEALFADAAHDLAAEGDAKGLPYRDHGASFSDLASETLQTIIKDCVGISRQFFHPGGNTIPATSKGAVDEDGHWIWRDRQAGKLPGFPPVTVYVDDEGKVRFQ